MTEQIKLKEQRITEIATLISMAQATNLTGEQRAKVSELSDRMEFRINALWDEFRERELGIKIEVMESVLKIYQGK